MRLLEPWSAPFSCPCSMFFALTWVGNLNVLRGGSGSPIRCSGGGCIGGR